ncbi:YycH family regulatory protein [Lentibacillus sp. Marseille-P4043]|uniref:YycH family regulatory protein n=1 Tax=Lentibacillus sp. Marseille-P4043 TaxID=2040293 RepID=UPI000D0B9E44|nr:two-component system activity regulator YycH [Lentibacillus sp. Marseille-P4043]
MKLETVKSFILVILVGISLLLTLGIWSYQPNYKSLSDMDYAEADIGGKDDVSKKDLVEPKSMIFHNYSQLYGFSDPKDRQTLYRDMQSWVLYNFETKGANGPPTDDYQVELLFPDELPMEIVNYLFTLNDEVTLPEWSFQRLFITFDINNSSLELHFLSTNGDKQASFLVNNSEKFDLLWSYTTKQKGLSEYVSLDKTGLPVYIPKHSKTVAQRKLTVTNIDADQLVNALFSNPEIVRRNNSNLGGSYYTDGIRGMRVQRDGRVIEFVNPLNTNYERMAPLNLLDTSMTNINEHKGWTGDYNLEELKTLTNLVRYRMYYAGYPVFNSNLSVIEQEWRNNELYKYHRPLFKLNTMPGQDSVELKSGNDVIYFLQNSNYKMENIEDIQIGYHLEYEDNDLPYYLTLKPAWYVKESGNWKEITFDELPLNKGGS